MTVDDDVALLAFCANVVDWMTDRTLGPARDRRHRPGTGPRRRAGRRGRGADAELIAEVETEYWQRDGDLGALQRWRDDITDPVRRQAVSRYLDERSEPPSDDALDRFVVYSADLTLSEQVVIYLDRELLSPATGPLAGRARIDGEMTVAGSGEWRTVDPDRCVDVPLRSGG